MAPPAGRSWRRQHAFIRGNRLSHVPLTRWSRQHEVHGTAISCTSFSNVREDLPPTNPEHRTHRHRQNRTPRTLADLTAKAGGFQIAAGPLARLHEIQAECDSLSAAAAAYAWEESAKQADALKAKALAEIKAGNLFPDVRDYTEIHAANARRSNIVCGRIQELTAEAWKLIAPAHKDLADRAVATAAAMEAQERLEYKAAGMDYAPSHRVLTYRMAARSMAAVSKHAPVQASPNSMIPGGLPPIKAAKAAK
jgi:hypothetical protein